MDQIMNYVIIAVVLIILAVVVVYSLLHRAKHDPQSFENKFFRDFDDLYDDVESRGGSLITKRSDRPAYPDINDPKYMVAWAKEKEAEEKMKEEALDDLELWEEGHR